MKRIITVVLLIFCFSSITFAQQLGLKSISPRIALLLPESNFNTGFSIGAKANLGVLFENVELNPIIAYWSTGYDYPFTNNALSVSNIQIGADLHYLLPTVQNVYVGGGLSLNFLSIDYPSSALLDGSSTTLGVSLLGGYNLMVSNLPAAIEARYTFADLDAFEIAFSIAIDMQN